MLAFVGAAADPPPSVWVPMAVAVVALVGVGISTYQKARSDRRQAWWARTQWALDKAMSDDEEARVVGLAAMTALQYSRLMTAEEREMLDVVADAFLSDARDSQGLGISHPDRSPATS